MSLAPVAREDDGKHALRLGPPESLSVRLVIPGPVGVSGIRHS